MIINATAGDILIKHNDKSSTSRMIMLGQLFSKGKSKYVHAAIATPGDQVIEVSGTGMAEHSLARDNAHYTYDVFSCRVPGMAEGAGETAKMLVGFANEQGPRPAKKGSRVKYSKGGALMSLFRSKRLVKRDRINTALDQLLAGDSQYYFCSGFVVQCYIVAAEQAGIEGQILFKAPKFRQAYGKEDACYNPSYLHRDLQRNQNFIFRGTGTGREIRVR